MKYDFLRVCIFSVSVAQEKSVFGTFPTCVGGLKCKIHFLCFYRIKNVFEK